MAVPFLFSGSLDVLFSFVLLFFFCIRNCLWNGGFGFFIVDTGVGNS